MNKLEDRLIIITGFGRSGTTILGKVLGSMHPSAYCFEPPLMKYLAGFERSDIPAKLLFETHFLQIIQGRGNSNSWEDSFMYHYLCDIPECERREDAVNYLNDNTFKFICKNTEMQYQMELCEEFFPGVKFVHIIRNGHNAVYSALSRGWYTDEFCNSAVVEDMYPHFKCNIPRFIDSDCWELWPDWNAETRAACAWRCAVTSGIKYKHKHPKKCIQFKYEDFILQPIKYCKHFSNNFGLVITNLTMKHIRDIHNYKLKNDKVVEHIGYTLLEPERTKFLNLNRRLKYE